MLCYVWRIFMAGINLQYGTFQFLYIWIGLRQNEYELTSLWRQPILHKFSKEKTLHLTEKFPVFANVYIMWISQRKEIKLFWNVNAYFTKDVASRVHMYSWLRMKLKHQWSKYSTGKYTQFILVVKMTCWAKKCWNSQPFNLAMKTRVFPFTMAVCRNVKKILMIGMYHMYIYFD